MEIPTFLCYCPSIIEKEITMPPYRPKEGEYVRFNRTTFRNPSYTKRLEAAGVDKVYKVLEVYSVGVKLKGLGRGWALQSDGVATFKPLTGKRR